MKKLAALVLNVMAVVSVVGFLTPAYGNEPGSAAAKPADALLGYIRDNKLPCGACHSVSVSGTGPSFMSIAAKYKNQNQAVSTLKGRIERCPGRAPGQTASPADAAHLADLILKLAEPSKH